MWSGYLRLSACLLIVFHTKLDSVSTTSEVRARNDNQTVHEEKRIRVVNQKKKALAGAAAKKKVAAGEAAEKKVAQARWTMVVEVGAVDKRVSRGEQKMR
ncbi:hypothetical protein WG66_015638 [Moniliophthora roreri]|nr:hypothetical protein WG66_015638 [Moniliophthora roreri]